MCCIAPPKRKASRGLEALGFHFRRLTVADVRFGLAFLTMFGIQPLRVDRMFFLRGKSSADQLVTVSGINMVVPHSPGDMLG